MKKRILYYLSRVRSRSVKTYRIVTRSIRTRPLTGFFVLLALLLVVIIAGNILANRNQQVKPAAEVAKSITVYTIGSAPKVTFPAKIEKTGIIKIVAQTNGIVQKINVTEGTPVDKSTVLLDLSTNYKGQDITRLQTGKASVQYKNAQETFNIRKDLIAKQREQAEKNRDNTEQLRLISSQSISETQSLLDLNRDIVSRLDEIIKTETVSEEIVRFKSSKAQAQGTVNQLQNALRETQYKTDTGKSAAQLNDIEKDIALKRLDLEEKASSLNKELSRLELAIASITESLMHPVSPIGGQIQKVNVVIGQAVSPGTPLFTVAVVGDPEVTATVSVPREIAKNISHMEPSILHIDGTTYSTIPRYVSYEAVDSQMYLVMYSIPEELQPRVTHLGYINIEVPIELPNTSSSIPFVPIDAVYQTQDQAYLYVVNKDKAVSKKVVLGKVYGRYVEIVSGLAEGDVVILNRNIVAGDKVTRQTK